MPLELARQLLDAAAELGAGSAVLIGGEPTLYPYLSEVAKHARCVGISPTLITNGLRLSDEVFCERVVESGVERVTVSVKGGSEDQYLKLVRAGGFGRMLRGAENLRRLGVEPSFEITVVDGLLADIGGMLSSLTSRGIRHLTVDLASPVVTGGRIEVPGVPDPLELRDAMHRIYWSVDPESLDYVVYMTIPFCLLDPEVLRGLKAQDRLVSSCHVPRGDALVFDEHGGVLPCNHMGGHVLGRWGVDFSSARTLMDFWYTTAVEEFRSVCGCYSAEPCIDCPEWGECGGGCMIKWMFWDPADFIGGFLDR